MVNRSDAKKHDEFLRYDFFMEGQGGCYPPSVASYILRLSPSGLFSAAERGKLEYVTFQGRRFYGKSSIQNYKRWFSRKNFAEKKEPDKVCVLSSKEYGIRVEVPVKNLKYIKKGGSFSN